MPPDVNNYDGAPNTRQSTIIQKLHNDESYSSGEETEGDDELSDEDEDEDGKAK